MTNLTVIENKISAVQKYLKILEKFKNYSKKDIENDLNIRGALERYLYLAIQAAIDLSEAIISYKKFRKPETFNEAFYILKEEGIIDDDLTEKLAKMVGFRNIIAHDYEEIDYEIVYDIVQNKLKNIRDFLKIISEKY